MALAFPPSAPPQARELTMKGENQGPFEMTDFDFF
jgi:hypothetical protein